MSEMPSKRNWGEIAIVLMTVFIAFITAWNAFNGNDAKQNERLATIERLLCATDDKPRRDACRMAGVTPT